MIKNKLRYLFCGLFFLFIGCTPDTNNRKPGVCISFDDRFVDEWYEIKDLLNEYDAKVTFFITQFDSLSPSEVRKLKELQSMGHEIASHGALHVISEHYIKENSYRKYLDDEVNLSISSMERGGFKPETFAYPFGAKYWFTDFILLRKFSLLREVASHNKEKDLSAVSKAYYRFDGRKTLAALGIDSKNNIPEEMMVKALKRAADNNEVLLLFGHKTTYNPQNEHYEVDIEFLKFILSESKKLGLKFYKFKELKADADK